MLVYRLFREVTLHKTIAACSCAVSRFVMYCYILTMYIVLFLKKRKKKQRKIVLSFEFEKLCHKIPVAHGYLDISLFL